MIPTLAFSLALLITPSLQRTADRIPYCDAKVIVTTITETRTINGIPMELAGLAYIHKKKIVISRSTVNKRKVLFHECGHFIRYNHPEFSKYERYFDQPPYLREYSKIQGEDFPDSLAQYYKNPDILSRKKRLAIYRLLTYQPK